MSPISQGLTPYMQKGYNFTSAGDLLQNFLLVDTPNVSLTTGMIIPKGEELSQPPLCSHSILMRVLLKMTKATVFMADAISDSVRFATFSLASQSKARCFV